MHEIIVGLGFGDEGKGAAVDWLCATRDIQAVIRFNGGGQAAHNVVLPDGRHHTFSQFGSGTFHRVPTHLSEFTLFNPFNMLKEYERLQSLGEDWALNGLTVANGALLVTPYHIEANRRREDLRGSRRHGSTGQGVGETRDFANRYPHLAPHVSDMRLPYVILGRLEQLKTYYEATLGDLGIDQTPNELADMYFEMTHLFRIVRNEYINELLDSGDCVFEGAQGVLLDEDFGFHPHTTWSHTTSQNALALLDGRPARTIGITRTYTTRHGAGPFPTEDYETLTLKLPELHNGTGEYQGAWRVGALDLSLLNYAVRANGGVNAIMITHMDTMVENRGWMLATYGYQHYGVANEVPFELEKINLPATRAEQFSITEFFSPGSVQPYQYDLLADPTDVISAVEMATGVRPTLFAYGPTWQDRMDIEVNLADVSSVS